MGLSHTGRLPTGWPLLLIAAPASVAIWSGWVGLGAMCGFGPVRLLPGIRDDLVLNTAITLPIGMEVYSAYALGVWLSPRRMRRVTRLYAAWSSVVALLVGGAGQVGYHLLSSWGYQKAPVWVVIGVACLPVLVLGAAATLRHLLREDYRLSGADEVRSGTDRTRRTGLWEWTAPLVRSRTRPDRERTSSSHPDRTERTGSGPDRTARSATARPERTGPGTALVRHRPALPEVRSASRPDISDLLGPGREVAAELARSGKPLTKKALLLGVRQRGLSCSSDRGSALLARLQRERSAEEVAS